MEKITANIVLMMLTAMAWRMVQMDRLNHLVAVWMILKNYLIWMLFWKIWRNEHV